MASLRENPAGLQLVTGKPGYDCRRDRPGHWALQPCRCGVGREGVCLTCRRITRYAQLVGAVGAALSQSASRTGVPRG